MRRLFRKIVFILCWSIAVVLSFIGLEKWQPPSLTRGDVNSLDKYITERFKDAIQNKSLGSGGFALVQKGKIITERGFGILNKSGEPVSTDSSLYLLSSLSKAVTAWGIMKLVEANKIRLDEPVLPHLERWQFPGSEAYSQKVTVRHLLNHTAGFVDGYGHGGFLRAEEVQTIESSLSEGPADTNMGGSHAAVIAFEPGTAMSYSSAGYAVLQLLVEEITGKKFQVYMRDEVFSPLGMNWSEYDLRDIINNDRRQNLASQYDLELNEHPHRYYTNMAGVSLRSTIHDLAVLATSYYVVNPVLARESITLFSTPQHGTNSSWGLGHTLYGATEQGGFITGHGGGAFPASGAEMRVNPSTGNGIVMVASGSQNFISHIGDDWTYWETGRKVFDIRNVVRKYAVVATVLIVIGAMIIVFWPRIRPV